jgi:hypothetical protein
MFFCSRESGSTRCEMQKLSSVGKFHDFPILEIHTQTIGGVGGPQQKSRCCIFWTWPAVGTNAAFKKGDIRHVPLAARRQDYTNFRRAGKRV